MSKEERDMDDTSISKNGSVAHSKGPRSDSEVKKPYEGGKEQKAHGEALVGSGEESQKTAVDEAEALILLQQVTQETERRMDGLKKANRKVVTVIVVGVAICVFVAVMMLVINAGK